MVWAVPGETELSAVRSSDNLEALTKTTEPDSVYHSSLFRAEERISLSFREIHLSEDLFRSLSTFTVS